MASTNVLQQQHTIPSHIFEQPLAERAFSLNAHPQLLPIFSELQGEAFKLAVKDLSPQQILKFVGDLTVSQLEHLFEVIKPASAEEIINKVYANDPGIDETQRKNIFNLFHEVEQDLLEKSPEELSKMYLSCLQIAVGIKSDKIRPHFLSDSILAVLKRNRLTLYLQLLNLLLFKDAIKKLSLAQLIEVVPFLIPGRMALIFGNRKSNILMPLLPLISIEALELAIPLIKKPTLRILLRGFTTDQVVHCLPKITKEQKHYLIEKEVFKISEDAFSTCRNNLKDFAERFKANPFVYSLGILYGETTSLFLEALPYISPLHYSHIIPLLEPQFIIKALEDATSLEQEKAIIANLSEIQKQKLSTEHIPQILHEVKDEFEKILNSNIPDLEAVEKEISIYEVDVIDFKEPNLIEIKLKIVNYIKGIIPLIGLSRSLLGAFRQYKKLDIDPKWQAIIKTIDEIIVKIPQFSKMVQQLNLLHVRVNTLMLVIKIRNNDEILQDPIDRQFNEDIVDKEKHVFAKVKQVVESLKGVITPQLYKEALKAGLNSEGDLRNYLAVKLAVR